MVKTKIQLMATDNVIQYVRTQSAEMGLSMGAFINVCIAQYKQQQSALNTMGEFKELMETIAKLEEKDNQKSL